MSEFICYQEKANGKRFALNLDRVDMITRDDGEKAVIHMGGQSITHAETVDGFEHKDSFHEACLYIAGMNND